MRIKETNRILKKMFAKEEGGVIERDGAVCRNGMVWIIWERNKKELETYIVKAKGNFLTLLTMPSFL